MGAPAAKDGDQVVGTDTHIVLVPASRSYPPRCRTPSWGS